MSPDQKNVRLGFIGVGNVARSAHMAHLSGWDDVELVGFYDPDQEAARKTAAEYGGTAYEQPQRMLDEEQLDAVYVCVPPFAHGEHEMAVIERKLGLFVEKPIALTVERSAEIKAAIEESGVISAVGYQWRGMSTTKHAREFINGKPVSAAYGSWIEGMPEVPWWRHQDESGGQMHEQATHIVDTARYLIGGKVVGVYAQGAKGIWNRKRPDHDIHDNAIALLTFDHGCICTVGTGHTSRQGYRLGIDFILEDIAIQLTLRDLHVTDPQGGQTIKLANNPYEAEDAAFLAALRTSDPEAVLCSYADAFETNRITVAANESMQTGEVVQLG